MLLTANVDKKADNAQLDLEAQTAALKSSIANVDAKAEAGQGRCEQNLAEGGC